MYRHGVGAGHQAEVLPVLHHLLERARGRHEAVRVHDAEKRHHVQGQDGIPRRLVRVFRVLGGDEDRRAVHGERQLVRQFQVGHQVIHGLPRQPDDVAGPHAIADLVKRMDAGQAVRQGVPRLAGGEQALARRLEFEDVVGRPRVVQALVVRLAQVAHAENEAQVGAAPLDVRDRRDDIGDEAFVEVLPRLQQHRAAPLLVQMVDEQGHRLRVQGVGPFLAGAPNCAVQAFLPADVRHLDHTPHLSLVVGEARMPARAGQREEGLLPLPLDRKRGAQNLVGEVVCLKAGEQFVVFHGILSFVHRCLCVMAEAKACRRPGRSGRRGRTSSRRAAGRFRGRRRTRRTRART